MKTKRLGVDGPEAMVDLPRACRQGQVTLYFATQSSPETMPSLYALAAST